MFWHSLALLAVASAALGYVIKLKDGSLIFARTKYTVKGDRAIITLENGTVTAIKLDEIDVDGSEQYNKENFGNVIAIDTPGQPAADGGARDARAAAASRTTSSRTSRGWSLPSTGSRQAVEGSGPSFGTVDPNLQAAFAKIFDGASITQYKLTNFRGKTGVLVTTNTEEAVFNAINATARALSDPASRGVPVTVTIVLTTSSGESAGRLEMSPEQARQLVNGQVTAADFFVKNVAL